jgi:PIN domain nuclease of toxin-antitoxin system
VRAILDTHTFFWWMKQDPRLKPQHRALIERQENDIFVSAVTGWEIAIKVKLGKWQEAEVLLPNLHTRIVAAGFELLDVTFAQAQRAGSLDLFHRDPFDRLLAAQALDLDMVVATLDPEIARFGCRVL